jgi:hypothetical protein
VEELEQFPDINKLCNVASCWIYEYFGILLGAHPFLHISRIRVKQFYPPVVITTQFAGTSLSDIFISFWTIFVPEFQDVFLQKIQHAVLVSPPEVSPISPT